MDHYDSGSATVLEGGGGGGGRGGEGEVIKTTHKV